MIRTFIWGSCVSRDTFGFLGDDFELLGYVARQSFLSAGTRVGDFSDISLEGGFRNRVHRGDLEGDALDRVAQVADRADLVLLDLCDDRLGAVDVGGAFITRSVERLKAGVQERMDASGEILEFGSCAHLTAWASGLERTIGRLRELGLFERAVMLGVPWASSDEEGRDLPTSFGLRPTLANKLYDLYYEAATVCGLPVLGRDLAVTGASDHQWGPSPFHYTKDVYLRVAALIREHVTADTEARGGTGHEE